MLALCKAKMLRPQLLLIDELVARPRTGRRGRSCSTWCAPINADGTAVVLVEQSVNVALSLVEHAYFMEKGEIRFDGIGAGTPRARGPPARGVPHRCEARRGPAKP